LRKNAAKRGEDLWSRVYEPAVSYSRKKLEGVLDDASKLSVTLTRMFEESPKYLAWVRAGIPAKGA